MEFGRILNSNPWEKANFFSRIIFWWLRPLLLKGSRGNLSLNDLYECPQAYSSKLTTDTLQRKWEEEIAKRKEGQMPSLIKTVLRVYGWSYALNGLIVLFQECFSNVFQPIVLGYTVQHFAKMQIMSPKDLYLCSFALCFLSFLNMFTVVSYYLNTKLMGMKLRIACCSLIYEKALKISHEGLGKTTVGQMVNMLSNDVMHFHEVFSTLTYLAVGPIQIVIISVILWHHLSYASIAGVLVLLFYVPLQAILGKMFSILRSKIAAFTDERIRLMSDIISAIQVIKMYAWEYSFRKFVNYARKRETEQMKYKIILRCINSAFFIVSSKVILLLSFMVYVLVIKGNLTPEKVFVSVALFNNLKLVMTILFPTAIYQGAESMISLKRIERFLLLEEQESISNVAYYPKSKEHEVYLHKVFAAWNEMLTTTLHDITVKVKSGELLAVVGPVGCGKTSLLLSILGEIPIYSGEINVNGKIAYASQEPWVFGDSVKENILFGSEFDEEKYKRVLNVCALEKDIEQLHYGDNTLVGERGVCLSGGQKARINLARAVYFDADIFIMDDPLSAVDASVAKCLFEECINGYLKDKIRILVTHQTQFLEKTSQVLVLKEGKCVSIGTHQELVNFGIDFGIFMEKEQQEFASVSSIPKSASTAEKSAILAGRNSPTVSLAENISLKKEDFKNVAEVPKQEEEFKASGSVKFKIYREYIIASGSLLLVTIFTISLFTTAISYYGSDFWLSIWTNEEQLKYNIKKCWLKLEEKILDKTWIWNSGTYLTQDITFEENLGDIKKDCFRWTANYTLRSDALSSNYNLHVYSALVLVIFLFSIIRSSTFFVMCLKASINLHNKMVYCVLRAPIAFFGKNPIGRILNRFSNDMGCMDENIPQCGFDALVQYFSAVGIVMIVATVEVWLLSSTLVLLLLFFLVCKFYLPTARDIKRYEGICKSPMFSHLSTTLHGLTSIRAFKVQNAFKERFHHYQDSHTAVCFVLYFIMQWFSAVLYCLSAIFISSVVLAMTLMSDDDSHASKAGLAITSSLQLCSYFTWGVRQTIEFQCMMTSVERLLEYSSLKPEAALECEPENSPPKEWPTEGAISFKDVFLKYSHDAPPVLKNLTFTIHPREKIGIVGRTGAGKSSIINALFRMTEPDGAVQIDGVDTKEIGLHDLRKKISIIPQDPMLISGTLRTNLDPLERHSDYNIWQALQMADMKKVIECLPGGLDTEITGGGSILSVGQKQLLCLGRAILSKNRILVLDEATANVDSKTDATIQKTIRDHFKSCTVLTVAHRLHTIMDSDRIMVLDDGRVAEFDTPFELLKNSNSMLSHMVQITDLAMLNTERCSLKI